MEQRCSCGALLPPDGRFCHKCGAPQYEEDIQRMSALEAEAAPKPPPVPAAPVMAAADAGVGNLRAIGITMVSAAVALVGVLLVGIVLFPAVPLVLSASGFASARYYSAKRAISALGGALLGTMTGMWLFLIVAFLSGIFSFGLATPDGQALLRAQPPKVAALYRALEDPQQMFVGLLTLFFSLTLSSAFGGLLAVSTRRPNR